MPDSDTDIDRQIKELICEQLGAKEEDVTNSANIIDDLGADSLDTVELIMAIEEQFNIEIPDEEADNITTVGDIISYIAEHLK